MTSWLENQFSDHCFIDRFKKLLNYFQNSVDTSLQLSNWAKIMAHMLGQDLMASIDASICDHEGHHFFTYEATNETQGLLCCYDQWLVEDLPRPRPKQSRFCHIFLVQSLVWKYCLKLEGCLHNFFLIGPYSAAAEPNSAPKIVTQFLEPSLVLLRRFCLNVRTLRMPLNPRNHHCRYTLHSWSLVHSRGLLWALWNFAKDRWQLS